MRIEKLFWIIGLMVVKCGVSQELSNPFERYGDSTVSIILMGDNNFQYRKNPEEAFKYVMPTLRDADFRFLNLEGPFAGGTNDPDARDIPHKNWRHSNPDQVTALTAAGIDAVGVANNVSYPWQALMRSLRVLDSVAIPYAGGGKDIEAAHKPVILEKKGVKIGFMQYAATVYPTNHAATSNQPGISQIKVHTAYQPPKDLDKPGQPPHVITWLDDDSKELMVSDIKKLNEIVDVIIVSFHWGVSRTYEPVSYQSEIGKAVIDAGADVVFGHGPHRYQKIELYKGKPILHSLAQNVFDDLRADRYRIHREGLMANIVVENKRVKSIFLVPTWRDDDNFVRIYDPNKGKGKELFDYLESVNESGADLEIKGKKILVQGIR